MKNYYIKNYQKKIFQFNFDFILLKLTLDFLNFLN